ncbi:hypothetical protein I6J18_09715 [Peribacillus psychrosaccharolyticus]|uniref:SbsC C-terminal domain-containing protein n=1 Tax=Peribacillus psychrosaccharolyticus TaxID=1407 RepID=A0A974S227_PERPY|nr:hypothetical protein [Peribacillus psychrosaccharolyticus]MEC2055001.1 hypothetical protein [Peribacillus psychrosaccharolyticus]MED3746498.1 hypothetical protein [Peribacillus psychrosaccharolyticus]QQT02083.1 hypothetical protein I6J18_09715 [Peribacillus psychrosaccharolyticus]
MSKKKAIKITTATAIAASAFVAVAPTQSEAATSSVDKAITKATNQMAKAYDTYHKTAKNENKLPKTATIRNEVKLAKDYYAAAEKEIAKNGGSKTKKAAFTKKLNTKKYFLDRAEAYLAAINTNLNPSKTAFNEAVETGKAKNVVPAKATLVKDVDAFKATVAKIYGPDVRNLLLEKYATPATELSNSVNDELKVYDAYKEIEAGKFADLVKTEELINKVKPEADALKTKTTKLATTLAAVVAKNDAKFEELKTPAVKEVKAATDKTVEVTLETAKTDLTAKNFKVLVDGTAVTPSEVKSDAKGEVYTLTVAGLEGKDGKVSVNGKEAAYEFATPVVKEVSAVNGKQIEVKFNKAIKKSSVIQTGTPDTLVDGVFTINELTTDNVVANAVAAADGLAASLSEDGKTLTITADTFFDGRYEVITKADAIETVADQKLAGFYGVVSSNDTVKPSVTSVTYPNAKTARVNFSEPLSSEGTFNASYSDGTSASVSTSFTAGNKYIDINLASLTANKQATVTFVGIKDAKGNLATPNPVAVTVNKDNSDVTAPVVQSVTPISATSFDIKLSESVAKAVAADLTSGTVGTIKVGSTDVTSKATVDATDASVIHVTGITAVTGLQTISVEEKALVDFSGNLNAAFSKVVNFDADTVEPTVVSTSVQTISNVKYLVVDFNENVTPVAAKALVFNYVKDNGEKASTTVTTNATAGAQGEATLYNAVSGVSKSIKINLGTLAAEDYTVDLVAGLVEDGFGNDSVLKEAVPVTVGSSTVQQSVKLNADTTNGNDDDNAVVKVNSNTLRVNFSKELDIASATNKSNYSVEGSTVEKAEIYKNNSTDGYIVELTLAKNTVDITGEYEVTVSGVVAKNGSAMTSYTTSETLDENVQPTVTKAVLASPTTVTLTFSEAVINTTADTNDFELLIGGVKVAANDVVTTSSQTSAANTLTLTLEDAVTSADVSKGLALKGLSTVDIADGKGNKASLPVNITIQ